MGCDIHLLVQKRENGKWKNIPLLDEDMENRNYNLFAVLANVRNGTRSESIPFISEPKGFPDDFDESEIPQETIFDETDSKWMGDHSFSWVTLKELLDYNWNHPVRMKASVDKEFASTWDGKIPPTSYSAWSSHGVEITWIETVKQLAEHWYNKYIPWLQSLSNPEDVRLVFGFDS